MVLAREFERSIGVPLNAIGWWEDQRSIEPNLEYGSHIYAIGLVIQDHELEVQRNISPDKDNSQFSTDDD